MIYAFNRMSMHRILTLQYCSLLPQPKKPNHHIISSRTNNFSITRNTNRILYKMQDTIVASFWLKSALNLYLSSNIFPPSSERYTITWSFALQTTKFFSSYTVKFYIINFPVAIAFTGSGVIFLWYIFYAQLYDTISLGMPVLPPPPPAK